MNEETQTVEVETVEEQKVPAEPTPQLQDEKKYTDADVDAIIDKKLAKMNADEKKDYQLKQLEQELADREKAIARKELTAEAKAMLSERGLPVELVAVVDLSNAEAVTESVASIQKTWEDAVQKGVSDRMKGSAPIKTAPQQSTGLSRAQFFQMSHSEKAALKQSNPELYNSFLN